MEHKIVDFAIQLAVILFAISFHESAHAWMALRLGDTTARDLGRISLNPLRHIDPFGSVILPVVLYYTSGFIFAYAKPTPVDPSRAKNPRLARLLMSAAGPISNFLLCFVGVLSLLLLRRLNSGSDIQQGVVAPLWEVSVTFVQINFLLGLFNLLPIPPLDGSAVLGAIFGPPVQRFFDKNAMIFFLLLMMLSFTGFLGRVTGPVFRVFANVLNRVLS